MTEREFSTFYVANLFCGIDILLVQEINRHLDIVPIALAPPYIRGLMILRGQIVTVIDLGVRLGLGPTAISPDARCVILKAENDLQRIAAPRMDGDGTTSEIVGLLVDKVGDVVSVPATDIEPPPVRLDSVEGHFLSGVIKLHRRLLVTIKAAAVLNDAD